jgi:hypothetical protein
MMLRTPVCSYPIIVTHLSLNFLCLLLLYSIYLNGKNLSTLCLPACGEEPYSVCTIVLRKNLSTLRLPACGEEPLLCLYHPAEEEPFHTLFTSV